VFVVPQFAQGGQQSVGVLATRGAVREMRPELGESGVERFAAVDRVAVLIDHIEAGVAARISLGVSEQCAERG
jgi:hypothetical protein